MSLNLLQIIRKGIIVWFLASAWPRISDRVRLLIGWSSSEAHTDDNHNNTEWSSMITGLLPMLLQATQWDFLLPVPNCRGTFDSLSFSSLIAIPEGNWYKKYSTPVCSRSTYSSSRTLPFLLHSLGGFLNSLPTCVPVRRSATENSYYYYYVWRRWSSWSSLFLFLLHETRDRVVCGAVTIKL